MNNLLAVVAIRADLLLADSDADASALADLAAIIATVARGSELTGALAMFAGHGEADPRPVDLSALVAAELDPAQPDPAAGQQGVPIATDLRPVGPVLAQPEHLTHALRELVDNASNAASGRARPRVRVSVRPGTSSSTAELAVTDNGTGMDDATLARVGEPFFTTRHGHAGLGLAAVSGMVERLGGGLEIDSAPDRGTTVAVHLPMAAAIPPISAPDRVVVVDDGLLLRQAHLRVLCRAGFDAVAVESGPEALSLLTAQPGVRAVVTDVAMPVMTGIELAARIVAEHPTVCVLLVTGAPPVAGEVPADDRVALLAKPASGAELVAALTALLSAADGGHS